MPKVKCSFQDVFISDTNKSLLNSHFTAFEYLILLTIFANCVVLAIHTPYPNGDSDDVNGLLVSGAQ